VVGQPWQPFSYDVDLDLHPPAGKFLALQRAQVTSLRQQVETAPCELDLLALSVEKGGTSVQADAWLVAGTLQPAEAEFAFGYGVFLQLLDDLQDTRRDRDAGHMTVFSQSAGRWPLDRLAGRLWRLIGRLTDEPPRFAAPQYDDRHDLIRRTARGCWSAPSRNTRICFTPPFVAALERRWVIDFTALRRLRRMASKRYTRPRERLQRQGIGGLLDLVA
jgi:hypothetical protein